MGKEKPVTKEEKGRNRLAFQQYEPVEDFPGSLTLPWKCRCLICGELAYVIPATPHKKQTKPRQHCRHPDIEEVPSVAAPEEEILCTLGYALLGEGTQGDGAWRVRCHRCDGESEVTLAEARNTRGSRPCCAEAALRAAGYEPLAPYPGEAKAPWPAQCTTCFQERTTSLTRVRAGGSCGHETAESKRARVSAINRAERKESGPAPELTGDPEADAFLRMRSNQYEPLEPFCGDLLVPWKARCLLCGQVVHVVPNKRPRPEGAPRTLCNHLSEKRRK